MHLIEPNGCATKDYRCTWTNGLIHLQGSNECPTIPIGAFEQHIQMDPHTDGLAEEPGCNVGMDVVQSRMWMNTDT